MTRPIPGRVAPGQRRPIGAAASGQETVGQPGTARIAVDLLGGDHAPAVVVDGALLACQTDPALHLLLVGPPEAADEVRRALDPADQARVTTLPVHPTSPPARPAGPPGHPTSPAARPAGPPGQPTSSAAQPAGSAEPARPAGPAEGSAEAGVRAAVLAVAQGHADAVMSAGNTGATVTSAALSLGRWPGVRRPPLAAVLPTAAGRLVLLDVGSSVDPDEATLAMHARLGAAYAAVVHGVTEPRVGLLTIGTERGKGDRLRRALPALLAGLMLPAGARYVGLVEGNDVVAGAGVDVVVTDGFTGNVLLKGLETAYATIGAPSSGPVPPRAAALLGVAGTVVVCHGSASAADLAAGIAVAAQLHRRAAVAAMAETVTHNEVYP